MMKIIMYNNSLHSHFTRNLLVIEKTENIFDLCKVFYSEDIHSHDLPLYNSF